MANKVMTQVEKNIQEKSVEIEKARKAIKAREKLIDNSDIIPEEISADDWKSKEFKFPKIPLNGAYKQCGNSVVVPVIRRIAEEIMKVMK